MEIPSRVKELYRHWEYHTVEDKSSVSFDKIFKDKKLFEEISWFVRERINIWKKKDSLIQPPYTNDLILSTYRFCNIFREFDRQTIEFHTLLNPLRDNFPLWLLNIFYFRMVARPETVKDVGLLSFNNSENKLLYKRLMETARPRFGTPYVFPISVILKSETPTRELFIAQYLPTVMEVVAKEISTWNNISVYDGVEIILPLFGFNLNFLWTEVLIDVAYQFPQYIDLLKRFPIGTGSLPTLKRINPEIDPTHALILLPNC